MKTKVFYLAPILIILTLSPRVLFSQGWTPQNSGTMQLLRTIHFVNSSTGWAGGNAGTLLKTTNGGVNWSPQASSTVNAITSIDFIDPLTGWAVGSSSTILYTVNGGVNWVLQFPPISVDFNSVDAVTSSFAAASGNSGAVLKTSNGGATWGMISASSNNYTSIQFMNILTGYIAGTSTGPFGIIRKTTNGGSSWLMLTSTLTGNYSGIKFADNSTGWIISQLGGISKTTNEGAAWGIQYPSGNILRGISVVSNSKAWVIGTNTIKRTTDAGSSWVEQSNSGLGDMYAISFVDSLNGWAAGSGGVILRTINGGVTSITPVSNQIPDEFKLYQNFPNPFNPVTKIRFEIPFTERIQLHIYDISGKLVAALADEVVSPRDYTAEWNASSFPSGIYTCVLKAGSKLMTKKMVLVK